MPPVITGTDDEVGTLKIEAGKMVFGDSETILYPIKGTIIKLR